ncbi:MAG: hypothetical protein FWF51_07820 [Chitinivibrionia bacterium]|nr:hypothetical protein [Chitinivibrionia bacterium]
MKKLKFVYTALFVCGMSAAVLAEPEPIKGSVSERLDSIEAKTRNLNAKSGIYFGGNFYSRALSSKLDGGIIEGQTAKTDEALLYTGLDLSIEARPLDAVGGTAIIRMHHDWRNMFGAYANPLTLRWISVNGNARDIFLYNAGDFKQKYTPFTLWVPEPEMMFEPTVFARQREIAMGEEFLGDNNRVLQGANFNFGAVIDPVFQELRIGAFATRLRQAGKEKPDRATGAPEANSQYGNLMDRYATGFNADMKFVPGTELGGTFLFVSDADGTFNRVGGSISGKDWADYTNNMVFSGRGGVGTQMIPGIDSNSVKVGLKAEFAGSIYTYRTVPLSSDWSGSNSIGIENNKKNYTFTDKLATAFKGGLDGDFNFGANGVKLDAGFIANAHNFRNELAQSPAVFNRNTILNSANTNYKNIFDQFYVTAYTYMPGEKETGTKQPMKKSAYTRSTLNSKELGLDDRWEEGEGADYDPPIPDGSLKPNADGTFSEIVEQIVSSSMPFGLATPNRTGIVANLGLDFLDKAILVGGDVKILNEITGTYDFDIEKTVTQQFTEFTGGLSLDVAKFGNWWAYPFILSGSFKQTMIADYAREKGNTLDISFINGGAYWKFWKRAAIMGGYQLVNGVNMKGKQSEVTQNQSQWAGGFEYAIAEGGVLNATIGQVIVDNSAKDRTTHDGLLKGNSKSLRLDLNLTVKF